MNIVDLSNFKNITSEVSIRAEPRRHSHGCRILI